MSPPTRMAPPEEGDIFTPASDEHVARLAEIGAIRQLTDTMNRMGKFMQGLAEKQDAATAKLADMHTDITVMKLQDEKIQTLKDIAADHGKRLVAIELLHASQAGAVKGVETARQWAPTIISFAVAIFALIKTGAVHL